MERAPLDNTLEDVPGQIYAECPAGSVVLTHGDLWHGACDNRSTGTRRVIHLGFACPSTRPQYEIAGALPQTTRERFPCMRQLAPFRNWWRVPANCVCKAYVVQRERLLGRYRDYNLRISNSMFA